MDWVQLAVNLLSVAVSGFASYIIATYKNKQKEQKEKEQKLAEQIDNIVGGLRALLREKIDEKTKKAVLAGSVTMKDKEIMSKTYKAYHNLEGNDVATDLYDTFMELPIRY